MATTPLYKKLKTNGTTFYAFPGAAEDISAAYQNASYKMYFSKYVLLNLPAQNPSAGSGTNSKPVYWDFDNSFQKSNVATPASTYQDQFVESLRNYVANYEVTLKESKLNNTDYYYNNEELNTPTEKIFWKWCKKLGLIDFEQANNGDEYFGNLPEFERNNLNDDTYFPEILWKERTIKDWSILRFYESGESGFPNKWEIEFELNTTFKKGDIIQLKVTNSSLISLGLNGGKVRVLKVSGKKLVLDLPYNGDYTDTSASAKLVYNRLVQYIGEVNGLNNVQEANRNYTEVYAHIPDHTGKTPDVLFRTKVDTNYKPNLAFPILPSQYQPEILGAEVFSSPIVNSPQNYPGSYFGQFDTEDYTYETSSGDSLRRSGEYFGISGDISTPVVDSSLVDGLTLDFDTAHYVKMNVIGEEITNFDQFNALEVNNQPPQDFDFNAILWYYVVEDSNGNTTENIYGISIVDNPDNNPVPSEVSIRVPTFKKLVSTDTQDGTSYAFSLNLNFNIVNENPQDTYNPQAINSLFSMNLFNDAMRRLSQSNDSFLTVIESQNTLETEISNLKQLLYSQTDLSIINQRISNLELLLRLYSTNQMVDSDSISVEIDNTTRPSQIKLNSVDTNYNSVFTAFTSQMYNQNGVIPFDVTIPVNKSFLVNVINDDTTDFNLPNNEVLTLVLDKDLYFKQTCEIVINSNDLATQNKRLDIYINYKYGSETSLPVVSKLTRTLDLPIYLNTKTSLPNSSYTWNKVSFDIDMTKDLRLNTGGILEVPISSNGVLVNNSFKSGDTLLINDFNVGTISNTNFSGQYKIDSVGSTNSYVYFDVSNNDSLISYGASSSLPLTFNSSSQSLLSNIPYLDINKGVRVRITRVNESATSPIEERYLVEYIGK